MTQAPDRTASSNPAPSPITGRPDLPETDPPPAMQVFLSRERKLRIMGAALWCIGMIAWFMGIGEDVAVAGFRTAFLAGVTMLVLVLWAFADRPRRRFEARLRAAGHAGCLKCGHILIGLPEQHGCPGCKSAYELESTRQTWVDYFAAIAAREAAECDAPTSAALWTPPRRPAAPIPPYLLRSAMGRRVVFLVRAIELFARIFIRRPLRRVFSLPTDMTPPAIRPYVWRQSITLKLSGIAMVVAVLAFPPSLVGLSQGGSDAAALLLIFVTIVGLLAGVAGVLFVRYRRAVRALIADDYARCLVCEYLLHNLPEQHTCPECGTPYELERTRKIWQAYLQFSVADLWPWHRRRIEPSDQT